MDLFLCQLRRCGSLSLDRTVSPTDTPIISYPPATSPLSYASIPILHASAIRDKNGKIQSGSQTGMTPKKLHEVIRFGSLVGQLLERDDPPTHAIDIGSGRVSRPLHPGLQQTTDCSPGSPIEDTVVCSMQSACRRPRLVSAGCHECRTTRFKEGREGQATGGEGSR
jgi:hypothetical protein